MRITVCCCEPVVKAQRQKTLFYASKPVFWIYHDPFIDRISKNQYSNGICQRLHPNEQSALIFETFKIFPKINHLYTEF